MIITKPYHHGVLLDSWTYIFYHLDEDLKVRQVILHDILLLMILKWTKDSWYWDQGSTEQGKILGLLGSVFLDASQISPRPSTSDRSSIEITPKHQMEGVE